MKKENSKNFEKSECFVKRNIFYLLRNLVELYALRYSYEILDKRQDFETERGGLSTARIAKNSN